MPKIRIISLCAVAALLTAASGWGYTWTLRDPYFLSKNTFSLDQALSPPPAPDSIAGKADFKQLHVYQETRTPADCKRAESEVQVSLEAMFGPKYGPLSEEEVTKWQDFFDQARNDTDYFVQLLKKKWNRPRPYFTDPTLSPCVKREVTGAYPSGHAAISRVFAHLLDDIYPKQKKAIDRRAKRIAEDRVLAGVHHPADIEAGKKFGDEVYEALMKSPAFKAELEKRLKSN